MRPAPDEIAKLEHELNTLRSRYAIFEHWAKITKWFFIGLAGIILLALAGYGLFYGPLAAVVVGTIFVMISGGLYLARDGTAYHRWIDVASPPPGWPWGRIFNIGPKSEAAAIEAMIADGEARLAELKGSRR